MRRYNFPMAMKIDDDAYERRDTFIGDARKVATDNVYQIVYAQVERQLAVSLANQFEADYSVGLPDGPAPKWIVILNWFRNIYNTENDGNN